MSLIQLLEFISKCHRNEDCPNPKLVDGLNRVKWMLPIDERAKVNTVLDDARTNKRSK